MQVDVRDSLDAHQKEILDLLRSAQAMLLDPLTRDVAGLARARWALMRALTAYQLAKQSQVFGPALARGTPDLARSLEQPRASADAAVEDFRGNVIGWSAVDVAAAWLTYQPSALAMIARLREQVTRERGDLLALVNRAAIAPGSAVPLRPTLAT